MLQGKVRTDRQQERWEFCCSFVENLLQYLFAKNYLNILWFDKVIAKIKGCNFLPNSVVSRRCISKRHKYKLHTNVLCSHTATVSDSIVIISRNWLIFQHHISATVFRKNHPLLFSSITLRKSNHFE